MTQRLENARQKTGHGFKDLVEVARWNALTKSRGHFKKSVVLPGRVGELIWDSDGWPVLPIDPPILAAEARTTWGRVDKVSVLTATSKMNAISFSLAAGPPGAHGTCVASNLSTETFKKYVRDLDGRGYADVAGTTQGVRTQDIIDPGAKSISKSQVMGTWICDSCYAGKGNYAKLDSNQIFQIARKIWVDRHIASGDFARIMVDAIKRVFGNDGLMKAKVCSSEYFRIHDSGDFFPVAPGTAANKFAYFDAWITICREMPDVRFWCPTRMWIVPEWREYMIASMSRPDAPRNLIIRPSALIYGVKAPKILALAAGSTSSAKAMKPEGHWDCPAYDSPEGSCVGAGCRVCWNHPQLPVNYKVH